MTLHLDVPARAPDWQDCHEGPLVPPDTGARRSFERALAAAPAWIGTAMGLRNLLVAPFGLKTGIDDDIGDKADFLARLPVLQDRLDVFETGLTDRHLTFTLRVETHPGRVTVRTLIWFHGLLGRVYLYCVLPAHKLILRRMVASLGVQP